MQFTPKSKEELAASNAFDLIQKGTYDVECISAIERKSSNGNDMFALNWRVFVGESVRLMFDYIVPSNDMGLDKLFTLCQSVGLSEDYESGNLDAESFVGKCCKASIVQKKQKGGEYDGQMQNQIASYMNFAATGAAAAAPAKSQPADEEDSPFLE